MSVQIGTESCVSLMLEQLSQHPDPPFLECRIRRQDLAQYAVERSGEVIGGLFLGLFLMRRLLA